MISYYFLVLNFFTIRHTTTKTRNQKRKSITINNVLMKTIDKKLDDAWSLLVKLKAGMECEIETCRKTKYLNSHHIFTRRNKAVRWCVDNGVALCPSHHTLNSKFSAHATPVTFTSWLEKKRGKDFIEMLTYKSNQVSKLHKFEKELLLKILQDEIKEHQAI